MDLVITPYINPITVNDRSTRATQDYYKVMKVPAGELTLGISYYRESGTVYEYTTMRAEPQLVLLDLSPSEILWVNSSFNAATKEVAYSFDSVPYRYSFDNGVELSLELDSSRKDSHIFYNININNGERKYNVQNTFFYLNADKNSATFSVSEGEDRLLVIDGIEQRYKRIHTVRYSPDGKRLAYIAAPVDFETLQWTVVVDGVMSPLYNDAYFLCFSPDSQSVAFVITHSERRFLVVDGRESRESFDFVANLQFSENGDQLLVNARREKGGERGTITIDLDGSW